MINFLKITHHGWIRINGENKMTKDELIEKIIAKEWLYFSNLNNIGGRAACQDNKEDFVIMRKAQWLTFDLKTLESYWQDLNSLKNPLFEKYARMMKNNNPVEYEKLGSVLEEISLEKRALVNKIMLIYMEWEEEFFSKFPIYASMGRVLYSFQDSQEETSIETYLRGELYSYSERTLILYLDYIRKMYDNGENLAIENMNNIAKMQDFKSCEDVENYYKSSLSRIIVD